MPLTTADHPSSGTVSTFADGTSSTTVDTNSSAAETVILTIPKNSTIGEATFHLTYDIQDPSPGAVTLDIDSDGQWEWHLGSPGDGGLGEQTEFDGGATSTSASLSGNQTWIPAGQWRLPQAATMSTTDITVGFTPTLGSQFSSIGATSDLGSGDMDGDGHDDAIYLVTDHVGTNGTAWPHIGWLNWTGSAINTNWIATCEGAERFILGDSNNDGQTDILSIDESEDTLCQHLSGSSNWAHSVNLTMNAKFVDALLADLDGDGQDDIVTLDADGTLGMHSFNAGGYATAITATVSSGSQMPGAENFANIAAGAFFGNGTMIAVAEEDMMTDFNTLWNFSNNNWVVSTQDFECTGGPLQAFDWNGDGVDDLMGPTPSGGCLATWNGTDWNTQSISLTGLTNATVGDHDGDGDLDLFRAIEGSPDGSDSTQTGSLDMHAFDGNGGILGSATTFNPHTSPRDIVFVDLDGDGLSEQIISAGEASAGLFIGAWNFVEWDLEGDGIIEKNMGGYASSTSSLSQVDQGMIIQEVSAELINAQTTYDGYETAWANLAPVVRSNGAGIFSQSELNMTYTATFIVEVNPTNTNLSNVLNTFMVLGSGHINVNLNITSSQNGTIALDSVHFDWVHGTTNLQPPPAPILTLFDYDHTQVSLFWTNTTSPNDLLHYQLFRAPVGTQININQPLIESPSIGYMDTDSVTNIDWDYAVRSEHEFAIFSPLSNIITVQVPDTPPVVDTTPPDSPVVVLLDVPGDTGGAMNLSFTPSASTDVAYTLLFLETNAFTNATGLTPFANVSVADLNTHFEVMGLVDGQNHWAAAVAVDGDDNAWWNVSAIGPVYSTNETTRASMLSLDVTGAGDFDDGTSAGVNAKAGSPLSISLQLTTEGAPLSSESIDLTLTTSEGETTQQLITGVTGSASLSWSDWLDYVATEGAYGGIIQISASWGGGTYGAASQTVAPTNAAETVIVTVDATLEAVSTSIQLDADGIGTAELSLSTPLGLEQAVLDGLALDWQLGNGTSVIGESGSVTLDAQGEVDISIDYSSGGWLDITPQAPWWLDLNPTTIRIDLYPPPPVQGCTDATANNFDTNAAVDDGSCTYDSTLVFLNLQCNTDSWTILDNNTQTQTNLAAQSITCTLQNPNDVDVQLEFDFDFSRNTPTFSHDLSSSTVWIENLSTVNFTLSPNAWQEGTTLDNGTVTVTVTLTATDWVGTEGNFLLSYGFTEASDSTGTNGGPDESTGSNKNAEKESSPLLMIAAAALIVALVGFVGLRMLMRESENDDDDEEEIIDEDWEKPEPEKIRTQIDLDDMPTGRSLDELTSRGGAGTKISMTKSKKVDRRAGSRPAPVRDVIEDAESEADAEEEGEWDYTDDEDYHVDDEGVEWWKDEVGQWWFKFPDEEDWEALEE